jgi:hypothetical protein
MKNNRLQSFIALLTAAVISSFIAISCNSNKQPVTAMKTFDTIPGTFGYDLAFLNNTKKPFYYPTTRGKPK